MGIFDPKPTRKMIYTKNAVWSKAESFYFREVVPNRLYFAISDYVKVFKRPKFGFFNVWGEDITQINFAFGYWVYSLTIYFDKGEKEDDEN